MSGSEEGTPELRARAQAAAATAASHAASTDGEGRFPREAMEAIKAQRLLGVMIPESLGGEGASLAEVANVCYQLGRACGSTGMIYAMHQVMVACLVRHSGNSKSLRELLAALCSRQLLLASSTTEGQAGGNVRASEAPVEHQGERITLERRATVISYGAHADGIVTTARRSADADPSDQVLVAFLSADYTLTPLQGWDTLGMRGTCSEGYVLKASGASDLVLPELYANIHPRTMVPTAHVLWGSVWAGIAASAVARAQTFVRQAARRSGGQLPPGAPQLTRAVSSLQTLRGLLGTALRSYQAVIDDPKALASVEFQSMITLTKVEASELAVSIVMMALRTCGLSGYRCDGEFTVERHLRDVLSAPLMINNDRILTNLASPSLLAPIPTTISE